MAIPFLNHLKKEVKNEVKKQIFRQNLNSEDIVKFSEKDLEKARWKEDKEFILDGYYYDVVSIKTINGVKIHYCFKDKKETKIANLETKIRDIFSVKFSKPQIKPLFAKTFKTNPISRKNSEFFATLETQYYLRSNFQYQFLMKFSDFIEKPTIPPEV